ncbi:Pao retrotransposon peptidase [Popillia japonica]|uniref:Pao retrotransposon peptidase n=1 Tax=Popillia japonica TaxID=7064 RepID=A0AAW1IAQ7_POPJA
MQEIGKLKVDWDESLSLNMRKIWSCYIQESNELNDVKIPRNIISIKQPKHFELHGFCDASEKGYGACIYIRAINGFCDASEKGYGACIYIRAINIHGNISCNLLCAQSRIAPIKPVTIPRLELCGALLVAQLISKLTQYLWMNFRKIYCWTDLSIVLSWIPWPKAFKAFVANRIAEIQELTDTNDWHNINTKKKRNRKYMY